MARKINRPREFLEKLKTLDMDKISHELIRRQNALNERREDIGIKLSALQDIDDKLSDWEMDFVNNCTDIFERKGDLSDGQYEKLLEIAIKYDL